MDNAARQPTPADSLYLALGRFVVAFSQYIGMLQLGFRMLMPPVNHPAPGLLTIILTAETDADILRRGYFAACAHLAGLDQDELEIARKLERRAEKRFSSRVGGEGRGDGDAAGAEVDEGDEGVGAVEAEGAVGDQADLAVEAFEAGVGSIRRLRTMARISVIRRGCG